MKLAPAEDFNKRQSSACLWTGRGVLMKGLIKLFVRGWRVTLLCCCSLWWVMYCLDKKIEGSMKRRMEKWNYCQYITAGLKLDLAFSYLSFNWNVWIRWLAVLEANQNLTADVFFLCPIRICKGVSAGKKNMKRKMATWMCSQFSCSTQCRTLKTIHLLCWCPSAPLIWCLGTHTLLLIPGVSMLLLHSF